MKQRHTTPAGSGYQSHRHMQHPTSRVKQCQCVYEHHSQSFSAALPPLNRSLLAAQSFRYLHLSEWHPHTNTANAASHLWVNLVQTARLRFEESCLIWMERSVRRTCYVHLSKHVWDIDMHPSSESPSHSNYQPIISPPLQTSNTKNPLQSTKYKKGRGG